MDWEKIIPERYRILYERSTGAFKILDTWHESVKNLPDLTEEIPDDSPAVKILNTLEVNSLMGELERMGWLKKFLPENSPISIANVTPPPVSKTIHEVAIENIKKVVETKADEGVLKEAILAIRSIVVK